MGPAREGAFLQDAMEAVAEDITLQVKRGIRLTGKKGEAAVSRTRALKIPHATENASSTMAPPPPSTGLRKSTRKRATKAQDDLLTPMNAMPSTSRVARASASVVKGNPTGNQILTPNIRIPKTPSMMTPLNRSVARVAKPGETLTLVSENCSPIVNGSYTATKKGERGRKKAATAVDVVPIPLGDGRTLMLPMHAGPSSSSSSNPPPELADDEVAKDKLIQVRKMMDDMLKMYN
jgi:hypothetical protein